MPKLQVCERKRLLDLHLMFVNKFNWHAVPEREKKRHKNPAEPVWSPTMAGGLFSIDRAFFERIGTYDSGFDIWGGENLELSFKTWMCGGKSKVIFKRNLMFLSN